MKSGNDRWHFIKFSTLYNQNNNGKFLIKVSKAAENFVILLSL